MLVNNKGQSFVTNKVAMSIRMHYMHHSIYKPY